MIYDEKMHYNLVFNEFQTVGYSSGFAEEYERKKQEQAYAVSQGKPMLVVNNFKEFGLACLLIAVAFIIGVALRFILPCGRSVIFHMVAAAGFVIAGIVTIKSNTKYTHLAFKDALSDNICGTVLLAEAIAIVAMWFNLPFKTDWDCNFFIGGTAFLAVGLVCFITFIMLMTKGIRLYTRSVDATCIGYVRKRRVDRVDGTSRIRWYNSPVFRYNAGGREMIAFYDTLSMGIDSKIPMGPCTININENEPGAVYNPSKAGTAHYIVIGMIMFAIALFLIYGVIGGHVEGSSIAF